MSRAQLIDMAKQDLAHGRAGTQSQADDILRIPAISYTDEDRWQLEMDRIFKRVPLMVQPPQNCETLALTKPWMLPVSRS